MSSAQLTKFLTAADQLTDSDSAFEPFFDLEAAASPQEDEADQLSNFPLPRPSPPPGQARSWCNSQLSFVSAML